MKTIISAEELPFAIEQNGGVILYFYNDTCAPCVALRPKIQEMVDAEFPKMELLFVNSIQFTDLAASYGVFASPTIIVFFDGRENFRVSKYISITELSARIERYYMMLFDK